MRNTLLLRRDPADLAAWRWLIFDQEGRSGADICAGSTDEMVTAAAGRHVVVLVPGSEILLTDVTISINSRQKLLRAVPYALEEQVSEDVDDLHFAVGSVRENDAWPVAIISKQAMDALCGELSGIGLDIQKTIPEVLALPFSGNETCVLVEHDVALVRTGNASGFAADSDNLGMLLAARMADDDDSLPPLHLFVPEDSLRPEMTDYIGETRVDPYTGDPLNVFAQGIDARSINLLQGSYSRSSDWMALLRPWRVTAALLLAAILLSNIVMAFDYFRLSSESEQLQAQIEGTFKTALPDIRRIVNPRIQMQQQLDKLQRKQGSGGGFLGLLGRTGSVIKGMQGVEVDAATFRAGRLDMEIKVANLQLLDDLKQSLMKDGKLDVEIQSATTGADQRVQSRIRIAGAGS